MLRRRYEILLPLRHNDGRPVSDDTPEIRQFFLQFKATLLERFEQVEIYIASYPVDILQTEALPFYVMSCNRPAFQRE